MMNKKFILSILVLGVLLLSVVQIHAQQNQNEETRIEIKINGEINETQKAKINDLLNYFENQNPRLKIDSKVKGEKPKREKEEIEKRESKVEKYHFIPITISALIVIFILWLIITLKKEKKYGINLLNDIFLGLVFLLSAISGILLIYGYKFQGFDLKFWHVIVSSILLFAIIFHIITLWGTWLSYFKKISGLNLKAPLGSHYRLTTDKMLRYATPKLPSVTSFIHKPLCEISILDKQLR